MENSKKNIDAIKRAFKNSLGIIVKKSNYEYYESLGAIAFEKTKELENSNTRESEWIVFESEEDAENAAKEKVQEDLENEPYLFTKEWLSNHITISENDKNSLASEEADYIIESMSDDEIIEEAGLSETYDELNNELRSEYDVDKEKKIRMEMEDLLETAKEKLQEQYIDEMMENLKDPYNYFVKEQGIYSDDDFFKASFVTIDIESAVDDAINTDGISHFLDGYDGEEEIIIDPLTEKEFWVYGTN